MSNPPPPADAGLPARPLRSAPQLSFYTMREPDPRGPRHRRGGSSGSGMIITRYDPPLPHIPQPSMTVPNPAAFHQSLDRVRGTGPQSNTGHGNTFNRPPSQHYSAPSYHSPSFPARSAITSVPQTNMTTSASFSSMPLPSFVIGTVNTSPLGSASPATQSSASYQPRGTRSEDNTPTKIGPMARPALTLAEATHLLKFTTSPTSVENLPSISVSVALYSPLGSFMPPIQPMILTNDTHLKNLILKLQEHLQANLVESNSSAALLVQSIEVRVFDTVGLENLPLIEGLISGKSHELGKQIVGKTEWVAWDATGGTSEDERYWCALVRKLLVDVLRRGDKEGGKAPMLKVRTVVKLREFGVGEMVMGELVAGGGHIFRLPEGAKNISPSLMASTIITPRGSIAAQGGQRSEGTVPEARGTSVGSQGKEAEPKTDVQVAGEESSTVKRAANVTDEKFVSNLNKQSRPAISPKVAPALSQNQRENYKDPADHSQKSQSSQQQPRNLLPPRQHPQPHKMAPAASDDKTEAAEELLRSLGLFDAAKSMSDDLLKNIEAKTEGEVANENEMNIYKNMVAGHDGVSQHPWVEKGGYPKNKNGTAGPVDPEKNWETYQRWGEDKSDPGYANKQKVHDMFPMAHIPFDGPITKPWKKAEEGVGPVESEDDEQDETPKQMIPYINFDADELKQAKIEFDNAPENQPAHIKRYWEEQERIKGFAEIDDARYFPASNPEFVKRQEASKVFAAKQTKNPNRPKTNIKSLLSGPIERRQNMAQFESFAGPSNNMPSIGSYHSSPGTTFSHAHAAANNTFTSMAGFSSFGEFAQQGRVSSPPGMGFYDLQAQIAAHDSSAAILPDGTSSATLTDASVAVFDGPVNAEGYGEEAMMGQAKASGSYNDFMADANAFAGHPTAGNYDNYGPAVGGDNDGFAAGMMGDGSMAGGNMGGGNYMSGSMGEGSMGGGNYMGGSMAGGSVMSDNLMEGGPVGGNNLHHTSSFNDFSSMVVPGGPSDFRGMVTHGIRQPAAPYPNTGGWTSMNTAGATYNTGAPNYNTGAPNYNTYGNQPTLYNPHTNANTVQNRAMGTFQQYPQYSQTGFPNTSPVGRTQSRYISPMDGRASIPGNEGYAFNNMAVPGHPNRPNFGSYGNPNAGTLYTPQQHAQHAAGMYAQGGQAASHTQGLHAASNPASASRARRPIPILIPKTGGTTAGGMPYKLPSPTRQAIGYNPGSAGPSSSLGSRTPSPEKMKGFKAAMESAFNGKGSPSGSKKKSKKA